MKASSVSLLLGVSVLLQLSGLTVPADSQVILEIPTLPVVTGSDVTLCCSSKDQVALEAFFFRDGSKLGSGPKGQFTIRNISQSDEGLYWCYFDKTEESPRRWLSVRDDDAQVILEIQALPVVAGSDVTLRCRNKDLVALEAFFIRNGSKLGSGPEGQFTIRNFQQSDEGLYSCYNNKSGESPRRRLKITDSQVILEIPTLPVVTGSDVTLRCRSKDQVALEAFFFRNGSKLGSGPEGQFTIRNINQSDEGFYWCYFDQTAESPQIWLSVRGPPVPLPSAPSAPSPSPPPLLSAPPSSPPPSPPPPPPSASSPLSLPLLVGAAVGSLVLLVLVLVGVLWLCRNQTGRKTSSAPAEVTYADVTVRQKTNRREKRSADPDTLYSGVRTHTAGPSEVTYGHVVIRSQRTAGTRTGQLSDPDVVYSSVRADATGKGTTSGAASTLPLAKSLPKMKDTPSKGI
ncbi:high affinity immunoglobulin gamma Fc receptor I-like isoform X2 [Micropterus salmoides]|uniref:high affinity immunoglobulin gamma Fc receptor I-like isoform X2 n=1 Tax=Micropterus salmoides TaxID=27706 RepID=UPI0018EB10FB|nr:high affinity immunoglobulin gamma Fc receptor I-like isoform X2 [Micropterus salmoides]